MKKVRVLLVDDEERILNFLKSKLRVSGFDILTAKNGFEAIEQVHSQNPDIIVLDLLMPKKSGFEVLEELRSFSTIPVIILSAKGADTDKIKGLELGADDYLAKPFNPDELIARIEAILRRLEPVTTRLIPEPLRLGQLLIDFNKHQVTQKEKPITLTRIEWLLLSELSRNTGRLMLYEDLLSRVWGSEYRDDVQLLRTWISRLRKKLEPDSGYAKLIRTVPKTGYMIEIPPAIYQ